MVLEVLAISNREDKEIKGIQIQKGEVKTVTVCQCYDYIPRKSKRHTRKLLELIDEFGKVVGYKINTQKLIAILYTNNKISEREISESISFTITSEK